MDRPGSQGCQEMAPRKVQARADCRACRVSFRRLTGQAAEEPRRPSGILRPSVLPTPAGTRPGSVRTRRLVMPPSVPARWRSRAEGPATDGTNDPTRRVPTAVVPAHRQPGQLASQTVQAGAHRDRNLHLESHQPWLHPRLPGRASAPGLGRPARRPRWPGPGARTPGSAALPDYHQEYRRGVLVLAGCWVSWCPVPVPSAPVKMVAQRTESIAGRYDSAHDR
jgi:hypothetical protein